MHRFLILILFLAIINCDQNNSIKNSSESKSETEINTKNDILKNQIESDIIFHRIKSDTVKLTQDLKIGNTNHKLELKLYSLNDSSIVIDNQYFKEVCHNSAAEILLINDKDTILQKKLTKEIFKDSINPDDYKVITLSQLGYKYIRSNRIYFDVGFEEANNISCHPGLYSQQCDVGIFFRTNKKGKVSFWNFRDGIE